MLLFRFILPALLASTACARTEQNAVVGAAAADTTAVISTVDSLSSAAQAPAQPHTATTPAPSQASTAAAAARVPNELGRVPVLEYHIIGGTPALFTRTAADFRADLELLYERGYRPVSVSDLVDKKLDLPAGLSPVVFTFDDASPGQFRWIERNGQRVVDDTSAIGIWRDFQKTHADWPSRGTFCLLPGAKAGHAFFGEKGIDGQLSEWRFEKVRELAEAGFELCDHTLWHARLDKYTDAQVQEQIARGVLAIDSAVAGYRVRTFALPLGMWPKNRALAWRGSWIYPKGKREIPYNFDAVLEVSGGPSRSPHDPAFNPKSIPRNIVSANALRVLLDALDKNGTRYVSDGNPATVARPSVADRKRAPDSAPPR
ncbi:MAG: polysaccharide deacetylase family protein [Gemmatimonadaceae bacterium]